MGRNYQTLRTNALRHTLCYSIGSRRYLNDESKLSIEWAWKSGTLDVIVAESSEIVRLENVVEFFKVFVIFIRNNLEPVSWRRYFISSFVDAN